MEFLGAKEAADYRTRPHYTTKYGLGAVLVQHSKVAAYASRQLKGLDTPLTTWN